MTDSSNRWLRLETKAFLKRWGVLGWLLIGVSIWHTLRFGTICGEYWLLTTPLEFVIPPMINPAGPNSLDLWKFWEAFHFYFQDFLFIVAISIPVTFACSVRYPEDLVLTARFAELVIQRRNMIRRVSVFSICFLLLAPLISYLTFRGFPVNLTIDGVAYIASFFCWAAIYFAFLEFVVFIISRSYRNSTIVSAIAFIVAAYLGLRFGLLVRMHKYWSVWWGHGIGDRPSGWIAIKPTLVAGLIAITVSLTLFVLNRIRSHKRNPSTDH